MKYNNNPFNIRYNPKNDFLGMTEPVGGFCTFVSVPYAVRAVMLILRSYQRRGIFNIQRMITTFAPPCENNTSAYISFVCDRLAVHDNYCISLFRPLLLYQFLSAISQFETGYILNRLDFDEGYSLYCLKRQDLFDYAE